MVPLLPCLVVIKETACISMDKPQTLKYERSIIDGPATVYHRPRIRFVMAENHPEKGISFLNCCVHQRLQYKGLLISYQVIKG